MKTNLMVRSYADGSLSSNPLQVFREGDPLLATEFSVFRFASETKIDELTNSGPPPDQQRSPSTRAANYVGASRPEPLPIQSLRRLPSSLNLFSISYRWISNFSQLASSLSPTTLSTISRTLPPILPNNDQIIYTSGVMDKGKEL